MIRTQNSTGIVSKYIILMYYTTLAWVSSVFQWVSQDNNQFLQDKNIFEHTYFNFVMQMCSYLPSTLPKEDEGEAEHIALLTAKLTCSFLLETYIHSKEKPMMVTWIELFTKQFSASDAACEVSLIVQCTMSFARFHMWRACINDAHSNEYFGTNWRNGRSTVAVPGYRLTSQASWGMFIYKFHLVSPSQSVAHLSLKNAKMCKTLFSYHVMLTN